MASFRMFGDKKEKAQKLALHSKWTHIRHILLGWASLALSSHYCCCWHSVCWLLLLATTGSRRLSESCHHDDNDDDDDDDPGGHKTRKRAILGMVCTHSVLPEKAKTVSFSSSFPCRPPGFEQHSPDSLLLGNGQGKCINITFSIFQNFTGEPLRCWAVHAWKCGTTYHLYTHIVYRFNMVWKLNKMAIGRTKNAARKSRANERKHTCSQNGECITHDSQCTSSFSLPIQS